MREVASYDLRNIVRAAPRLTLAVNLLTLPTMAAWVWFAVPNGLPYALTLGVLVALLVVGGFFACLMVECFEEHTWIVLIVGVLLVYFWVAALIKLIRVVLGKADFPDLKP